MQIILPKNVNKIIHVLEEHGFQAYAVGGCIRDSLLGRTPHDWDITTSALPEQVKAIFKKTVDTGIQHGTVTILLDGEGYEVTTYRLDGEYEDSRHPKEVTFTSLLSEDLKRRDFTVNAMAYNEKDGLVDLFGGQKDMEEKVIRALAIPWSASPRTLCVSFGPCVSQPSWAFHRGENPGSHRHSGGQSGAHQRRADSGGAGKTGCFSPSRGVLYGLRDRHYPGNSPGV